MMDSDRIYSGSSQDNNEEAKADVASEGAGGQ